MDAQSGSDVHFHCDRNSVYSDTFRAENIYKHTIDVFSAKIRVIKRKDLKKKKNVAGNGKIFYFCMF